MSATWTFPGTTVRLTLDGTGSGAKYASKAYIGLTPSTLYTFYLDVNTDVLAVGAFLQVVGGDLTLATVTGGQTLRARGTTDGSGNITIRYGAQNIEAAPSAADSYPLDYANQAAAESDGFVVTSGAGSFAFGAAVGLTGFSTGVQVTQTGSGAAATLGLTLALTPSTSYTVRLRAKPLQDSAWFNALSLVLTSGANTASDGLNGNDAERTLSATVTTDGTGALAISVALPAVGFYSAYAFAGLEIEGVTGGGATLDFDNLTRCIGSGLSETGGTGLGQGATDDDPGNDPIPEPPVGGYPPPPVGGARPYGCSEIPPEGLGYWNITVKQMAPTWIENLVNKASTAGGYLYLTGRWKTWLDASGQFQLDLMKADMDAMRYDARANALLTAAISAGVVPAHYLIDEPFHPSRYGVPLSLATVEQACLYSKSLWPDWPVIVRVQPTHPSVTRHINGCDLLWASYNKRKGDVTTYRDSNIARAQALGHGLVIGVNIADFLGTDTRQITPDEYRYYGGILASHSYTSAFVDWRYESGLYTSDFVAANKYVRDLYASYDP